MKINIDVQYLCTESMRGIPYYILNLLENLVRRDRNEYMLSFLDYKKERENRKYVNRYLKDETKEKVVINEYNSLSFDSIIQSNIVGNGSKYMNHDFDVYMKEKTDICHIPQSIYIPYNIKEKAVVTVHDIIPLLPDARKYCEERNIKAFKNNINHLEINEKIIIIADSLSTKKDLMRFSNVSEDRVHVVPLAYDIGLHYPEKNERILQHIGVDKNPFLVYLGAIDSRKGIVDILEAFEIIKEKHSLLKLVLAGKVDWNTVEKGERSIASGLKGNKYAEDIILPGFVSDEQKRTLLSSAEAFLFPSEYEGFGLPVLEAMACGTPVITSNVSSLPEVGGDAAIYVTPKNPEELAVAITRLLDSKDLRKEYIKKGFEQCKKFSWDKTAEMTEEVYKIAFER